MIDRPVLILGAHGRIATAVARSLHRRGIPVIVAALRPGEERIPSRAIRHFVALPDFQKDPAGFWDGLRRTIDTWRPDLLLPGTDLALPAIAPHYAELQALLQVACPPPTVTRQVLDKTLTMDLAARLGLLIPATYLAEDEAGLEAVRDRLTFPLIAKTRDKACEADYVALRHFEDYESLRAAYWSEPDFGRRFLLQERVAGQNVGLGVLMQQGQPLALFQFRNLKTLPSMGGWPVLTRTEPVDPALVQYAVTLLRALRWEGIAQVDFLHDPATGRVVVLEVNGRFWASLAAASHAGFDFPWYVWQLAHGQQPDISANYPAGLRVRWLMGDCQRLGRLLRREDGNSLSLAWHEVVRFIVDFCPGTRGIIWSWTDPMPALWEFRRGLFKPRHWLRQLRGWLMVRRPGLSFGR